MEVTLEEIPTPDGGAILVIQGTDGGTQVPHEYIYPEKIGRLRRQAPGCWGTDGKVYECKPFPFSGWCTIPAWQYAPGTGPNWQDAWIAR